MSGGDHDAPIHAIGTTLEARGWTIRKLTAGAAGWSSSASLAKDTVSGVLRFRPKIALFAGSLGPAGVVSGARVPYVLLRPQPHGLPGPLGSAVVRRARALIVDRWAQGRAWVRRFGSARVVQIAPGLDLADHPLGDREEARVALGLDGQQRMLGLISDLDDTAQLSLLDGVYRAHPGVGMLVSGEGAQSVRVNAMTVAARPSAPVVPVGARSTATDLVTACAATIGLDLDLPAEPPATTRPAASMNFLVQGRRLVTIAGEAATPLLDLYPADRRAVHIARPTGDGVRAAIAAALEAEQTLGPLPPEEIAEVRRALDATTWPDRVADVVEACA